MPLSRAHLERQLEHAQTALNRCVEQLDQEGVPAEGRRRHPRWRSLRAKCRMLTRRLNAVGFVEQRDAAAAQRKAEPAQAEA
ncbi:MAG: hypothetical protein ACREJB_10020 [Planctomycetaceae bacterium]